MPRVASEFHTLLEATIQHLERLQRQGVRHVPVAPATLAALAAPASPPHASTKAAPVARAASPAKPLPLREPRTETGPSTVPSAVTGAVATPSASCPRQESLGELLADPSVAVPPAPEMAPEAKEAAMADLRARVLACQKCPHLVAARRTVVFGIGNIHAPLMFVGEAPGADEDEQGEPFVGKAGQLLTRIIGAMGFQREEVYIGNILKCRPDTPGQSAGNRKPTSDEMKTCLPHLLAQIDIIRPRVLVALGATAVEGLLGKTVGITRLRGNWQEFRGVPVMPTYHPAYLLRNQAPAEKRKVWEDMLQVLERLGRPISAKQRGYFLSAKP